ncbi:MAG: hypothetical protein KDE27_06325 [Planctomycetes bacterium]|nr:hypothetical protein [Planctomycetota bacterium]
MPRSPLLAALAALFVAAIPAAAQEVTSPSTRLQRAWMLEVLDLDTAGASRLYGDIVANREPRNFARWVAAARLLELQRLDVVHGDRVDYSEAPPLLRPQLEEADASLEIQPLIERLTSESAEATARALATPEGQLPPLRPLVASAESWYEDQALPSRLDRIRQRRAAWDNDPPPFSSRVFAQRVLRAELAGKREEADAKRSLYFTSWEPPAAADDPLVDLARIRRNVDELLLAREWTGDWRGMHQQLRDTIERIAAEDPKAAVAFVRRLPQYAERLLAPTRTQAR